MNQVKDIPAAEWMPNREDVLEQQGVPRGTQMRQDIEDICSRALAILSDSAAPVAVTSTISKYEFSSVFEGEGKNEADTPVGEIFVQAEHLLLFALTLGKETSGQIDSLFQSNDFALGCMLDAAASVAADNAAASVEQQFARTLAEQGWDSKSGAALRYSPGYCGWNISGQKRLFEFLKPDQIGLTLRPSFLMEPIKSVSGVVLAGPRDMHEFEPTFPSCTTCETATCRERISSLYQSE